MARGKKNHPYVCAVKINICCHFIKRPTACARAVLWKRTLLYHSPFITTRLRIPILTLRTRHLCSVFERKLWTEKHFPKRIEGLLSKRVDCVVCPLQWWLRRKKGKQSLVFLRCLHGYWPGICEIQCFWPRSSSGENTARQRGRSWKNTLS